MQIKSITRLSAVALAAALASGCATITQEQLDAVAATANTALSEARDASAAASNAQNVASEAAYSASQAQKAAESALACCNGNADKIERMFEKAMSK